MRRRTIKSVLRRRVSEWLDASVRERAAEDALVCGGAIMGEKVNDIDIYFRTLETTVAVAKYYVDQFKRNPPQRFADSERTSTISVLVDDSRVKIVVKSQGVAGETGTDEYQYFEQVDDDSGAESFVDNVVQDAEEADEDDKRKPAFRPKFLTSNAITLSHRVQVVIRFWGEIDEIHKNYDFVHCMCGWDAKSGELVIPQDAVESMLAKHLIYKGSLYPLCSMIRTRKFIARGWTIDAGQFVKIAWGLSELDLSDPAVLEDQMVGVDAAYFYQVLELLRERDCDKVDGTYLIQVIDRVFG